MDGFLDKLRLSGLFSNGPQPFGMPDISAPNINPMDAFNQAANKRRMFQLEDRAYQQHQQNVLNGQNMGNSLQNIAAAAAQNKPMDVVVGADSNPGASILAGPSLFEKQEALKAEMEKNKQPQVPVKAGSKLLTLDPNTGKVTDSGVNTGEMTDREKIDAQARNTEKQIEQRGKIQKDIAGTRSEGTVEAAATRTQAAKDAAELRAQHDKEMKELQLKHQKEFEDYKNKEKQTTSNDVIKSKTEETLSTIDSLLTKDGKLKPEVASAVGGSRMFGLQNIPGTQTKAGDVAIKQLKSMLTLGVIAELKAQSKTGATGFGNMSNKDLAVLENAASKLDAGLDEASFTAELGRIREKLSKALEAHSSSGKAGATGGKATTMSAADLIKKYSTPAAGAK